MGQGRGKKLTKIQYYRESQGGAEGAEGLPQAGEAGLSLGGTPPRKSFHPLKKGHASR